MAPSLAILMHTARSIRIQLLLLAAWMTVACTEPSASVRFGVEYDAEGAYADAALFRPEITQGGQRRLLRPWQLIVRSRSSTRVVVASNGLRLHVGELATVRVAIVPAPGDTVAMASVSWIPEEHWSYGVTAVVGIRRPQGFCLLSVSHAIPLPPRGGTDGDTLFIARGGLPDGAVC